MASVKRADWVAEITRAKMHLQNLQAAAKGLPKPWEVAAGPYDNRAQMEAYIQGLEFAI